jgi:hypothetical protein
MIANPRTCGMGAPCSPGATCEWSGLESGIDCECDDTGHYFCDAHAGGGAPPFQPCPPRQCAAAGETCELSNGYCTKTCVCGGACTTDCSGNGPPQHQGASKPCDLDFCKDSYLKWGGCSVKDGACDYTIDCTPADAPPNVEPTPAVTGRCD